KIPTYKIAEAARLAGVSASTLRLWESHGIVVPQRTPSGQRLYSEGDIELLRRAVWMRVEQGLNPAAIHSTFARKKTKPHAGTHRGTARDNAIGRRLRQLRRRAGKTLDHVAGEVAISASSLSTFERTSQGISFKALHDLAHYFGTTVS